MELAKTYEPQLVEDRIYQKWEESGFFHAAVNPGKKPYTIVMPPPNITGQLHIGHALDNTLQDILIRFRRMQGYEALWMPGTDHASIATELKIVEAMRAEGLTKADVGRDGFLKRAWEWRKLYGKRITAQLRKLGSSCDWERERFTMDDGCSKAVREVFCRLYEKGLIYRGERIVDWCSDCKTSISDAEVEYAETQAFFYHLRYPLADGSGYLELATTRPETMLGDTAVAVHPDDERYASAVGKDVILPIVGRTIPVIADTYVEMDFGTGVVKITPAHDPNDFEVGLRHNLPTVTVTTEDGRMNELAGKFAGLTVRECREAIVKELDALGVLVKTEPLTHSVGTCYRCHQTVEPRVSLQWFVKMRPLAVPAMEAVRTGQTRFVPERFGKLYFNWLENIRDWCISRQLWWGHRIPVWYCADCGAEICAREDVSVCTACGSTCVTQDEDVLDTWFSSALWPFSTLGWPKKTPELDYFYPTSTLVTGYDIITFWVVRMMFSGIEQMGSPPFETVFVHGLVRDAGGRKMSKSSGNGIDPLEAIQKYGADALRFSLANGNSPGNDMRVMEEKIEASRNFTNKLWNAARFVQMNIAGKPVPPGLPAQLAIEDMWILTSLQELIREATANLESFELGVAVQKLYDFIWDQYCDWFIECCKPRLQAGQMEAAQVLIWVLRQALELLHPFMPFITEEIWQSLPHTNGSIMCQPWPAPDKALMFEQPAAEMNRLIQVIRAIRNRRAEMGVPPSQKADLYIETAYAETFVSGQAFLQRLAGAAGVEIGAAFDIPGAISIVTPDATVKIAVEALVDKATETARLQKEMDAVKKQRDGVRARLNNPEFVKKAPAAVVEAARENAQRLENQIEKLQASLTMLAP